MTVLFVCLGNRVRSPMAHGLLRHKLRAAGLDDTLADSAGTHAWPGGEPPDREAVFEAARRGIHIDDLRSRALTTDDVARADLVLAMDWHSLALAEDFCEGAQRRKLRGLAEFMIRFDEPVMPDPAEAGYDATWARLDDACEGVLRWLQRPG